MAINITGNIGPAIAKLNETRENFTSNLAQINTAFESLKQDWNDTKSRQYMPGWIEDITNVNVKADEGLTALADALNKLEQLFTQFYNN